jgi:hypothetical protein
MFEALLERVGRALEDAAIPYMVIGGQAVLLYGEARLTRDIDITLGVGLEGLPRVLDVVRDARLAPLVDPETFTRRTMVLPCLDQVTRIRLDLIFSFSPYEREALLRARKVRVGEAQIRFASVEDLIILKIVAGRPRDLEDVASILLKNPGLDEAWVLRWLGEMQDTLGEPFVARFGQVKKEIG